MKVLMMKRLIVLDNQIIQTPVAAVGDVVWWLDVGEQFVVYFVHQGLMMLGHVNAEHRLLFTEPRLLFVGQ